MSKLSEKLANSPKVGKATYKEMLQSIKPFVNFRYKLKDIDKLKPHEKGKITRYYKAIRGYSKTVNGRVVEQVPGLFSGKNTGTYTPRSKRGRKLIEEYTGVKRLPGLKTFGAPIPKGGRLITSRGKIEIVGPNEASRTIVKYPIKEIFELAQLATREHYKIALALFMKALKNYRERANRLYVIHTGQRGLLGGGKGFSTRKRAFQEIWLILTKEGGSGRPDNHPDLWLGLITIKNLKKQKKLSKKQKRKIKSNK